MSINIAAYLAPIGVGDYTPPVEFAEVNRHGRDVAKAR